MTDKIFIDRATIELAIEMLSLSSDWRPAGIAKGIRRAIDEMRTALQASTWSPMNTAPHDGTGANEMIEPPPTPLVMQSQSGKEWPVYTADQLRAYAEAVRADERKKWIGGLKISIPTHAMEQEIAAHVRRAVDREHAKWADTLRNMAAVSWGEWDTKADPIEQGKAIALDHAAEILWPTLNLER